MSEKRNISRQDIYIKARIFSEGIRKNAKGLVGANITDLAARTGRSFHFLLAHDEITRRLQEAGKLPPGLPDQYGSDCPG